MPFNLSLGDITSVKCEVIVNSIGIDASKYGRICKRIIEKANSKELEARLSIEKNGKVGNMFLTDGYALKNKIIHVVSPFKKYDNDKCEKLKKIYDDVLKFAIDNNFKSIGLPFIASGANGYSDEEVYNVAMTSIGEILDKEDEENREIIDITLVVYLSPKNNVKLEILREEENKKSEKDLFSQIHEFAKTNSLMKKEDALVPSFKYIMPFDYIEDFVGQKIGNYKILNSAGYDHRRRGRLRNYIDIPRDDVYALIFVLNMNLTQAMQFITISGVAFSPCRKIDVFFRDYLLGKYGKVNSLVKLNELAYYAGMEDKYSFLKG